LSNNEGTYLRRQFVGVANTYMYNLTRQFGGVANVHYLSNDHHMYVPTRPDHRASVVQID